MENFNTNIYDYTINDIYDVFNVSPKNLTKEKLKLLYKKTLEFHPDKSNLPSRYFIFFSQAYKKLHNHAHTVLFREQTEVNQSVVEMKNIRKKSIDDTEVDKYHITKYVTEREDFNEKFNKAFEKIRPKQQDGYEKLLKTQIDTTTNKPTNTRDLHNLIEQHKQIIHHQPTIQNMIEHNKGSSLIEETKKDFSSPNIFGKFKYEDIKKVHHDETVIPITENDIKKNTEHRATTINTFETQREKQDNTPISKKQALEYFNQLKHTEEEEYERLQHLLKQEEIQSQQFKQQFWSNFLTLSYPS